MYHSIQFPAFRIKILSSALQLSFHLVRTGRKSNKCITTNICQPYGTQVLEIDWSGWIMARIVHVLLAFENIYIHKDDEHIHIFKHWETLETPTSVWWNDAGMREEFKGRTPASCSSLCVVGEKETRAAATSLKSHSNHMVIVSF